MNPNASPLTVGQAVFPLSAVAGIAAGDLANLRMNNGTIDVVTGSVPAITAQNGHDHVRHQPGTVPATSTVNYTLFGDAPAWSVGTR